MKYVGCEKTLLAATPYWAHWYFRPVPLDGHEDGFNRTAFGTGKCAPLNIIARGVWLYETEVRQLKADRTLADCHD